VGTAAQHAVPASALHHSPPSTTLQHSTLHPDQHCITRPPLRLLVPLQDSAVDEQSGVLAGISRALQLSEGIICRDEGGKIEHLHAMVVTVGNCKQVACV